MAGSEGETPYFAAAHKPESISEQPHKWHVLTLFLQLVRRSNKGKFMNGICARFGIMPHCKSQGERA
jgi:hypothetical protein